MEVHIIEWALAWVWVTMKALNMKETAVTRSILRQLFI